MKIKQVTLRYLILVLITGMALSSCSKDDDNTDDIVGTWTTGTSTVSIMVGTQTLTQYAIDNMGMTAEEAQAFTDLIDESVKQAFTGTVTIKADKTYTSNLGGTADSGTWSLNTDRTQLTLNSTADGPMIFDVAELTSSKLHLQVSETVTEDLNGDEVLELISLDLDINFTK